MPGQRVIVLMRQKPARLRGPCPPCRRLGWAQTGDPNVPVVDYCYWQNCSLNGQVPYIRRPVTDRTTKRILRDIDEWSFSALRPMTAITVTSPYSLPKPNGKKQLRAGEDRDLGDVTFAPRK